MEERVIITGEIKSSKGNFRYLESDKKDKEDLIVKMIKRLKRKLKSNVKINKQKENTFDEKYSLIYNFSIIILI